MAERQYTTRRNMLKALPLAAGIPLIPEVAQGALREDPIMPLYRQWVQARKEWFRLSELPENADSDSAEMVAAEEVEEQAFWAISRMKPVSMKGMAAVMHLLWDLDGPYAIFDSEKYESQLDEPSNRLMLALWQSMTGHVTPPPHFDSSGKFLHPGI